jgi:acetyl-CoA carboxylase carboxyl transferase subunit alpha
VLAALTPWERVQLARHPDRPTALDYVRLLCRDVVELRGDRRFADDPAVAAGIARLRGRAIVFVGEDRGRRGGVPRPEGFRKAVRLFRLADRFGLPVVTLIDTPGADAGAAAEERGQAEAIATSLRTMAGIRVPVVSAVIGEGGSGGALALAMGDRVLMQEHAWYSVISPEGCAAIIFRRRTPAAVARSAAMLRLTARDLAAFGVVDAIVPEPRGGAHRDPRRAARLLGRAIVAALDEVVRVPPARLVAARYRRYRSPRDHVSRRGAGGAG